MWNINFELLKRTVPNGCLCKLKTRCPCKEFIEDQECKCKVFEKNMRCADCGSKDYPYHHESCQMGETGW